MTGTAGTLAFVTEGKGFVGTELASCRNDTARLDPVTSGDRAARTATPPALSESFDEVVLPHLHTAQRLARWLMRNDQDAEDAVQEASLRALRYFRTFTGGNGRAWFLKIVRNTCRGFWSRRRPSTSEPFDETRHSDARRASDPETLLLVTDDLALVERAMSHLPARHRELFGLREILGLSYQELAAVEDIPIGTVMSSLARARQAFERALEEERTRTSLPGRVHRRGRKEDDTGKTSAA